MREVLSQGFDGEVRVIKETLPAGWGLMGNRMVYTIEVGQHEMPAVNEESALRAYQEILKAERIALGED